APGGTPRRRVEGVLRRQRAAPEQRPLRQRPARGAVKIEEKGKFLGTVGWSWDLGTIVGGLFPVGLILIGINQFVALLLIPGLMAVSYLTARIKNSEH
ncbi:MAG: hypothetical protein ACE1ZC_05755, partial [Nitrososphaerales archaeon]